MRSRAIRFAAAAASIALLAACAQGQASVTGSDDSAGSPTSTRSDSANVETLSGEELQTATDTALEQSAQAGADDPAAVLIALADGASTVTAATDSSADSADDAGSVDAVSIETASDGSDLIRITGSGRYQLTGTLTDGQILIDSGDAEVTIILNGVDLTSSTSAPLVVEQSARTSIVLATGSVNQLADADTYVYPDTDTDEPNAALFSFDDLSISGDGALTVIGNSNDGIASKDELWISGGQITVVALDDGIRGKELLAVTGGTIAVTAGGDGLKADADSTDEGLTGLGAITLDGGTITVAAGDDGVTAEGSLTISGGTLTVTDSYEAVEAATIEISGGTSTLRASDDAINAASDLIGDLSVRITGGTVVIDAEGDGLDSNGTLEISGGDVTVHGPTRDGNGAIDVDGSFTVSGGTLTAWGASGMLQAPDAGSNRSSIVATFASPLLAGTTVEIADASGVVLATVATEKTSASLIFTTDGITDGAQYTLTADGQALGSVTAGAVTGGGFGGPGGGPGGGGAPGPRG